MTDQPATTSTPEDTRGQWEAVAAALSQAAATWRQVSPESAGPVEELLADARWNIAYCQAREAGMSEVAAWRAASAERGEPTSHHIDYDAPPKTLA